MDRINLKIDWGGQGLSKIKVLKAFEQPKASTKFAITPPSDQQLRNAELTAITFVVAFVESAIGEVVSHIADAIVVMIKDSKSTTGDDKPELKKSEGRHFSIVIDGKDVHITSNMDKRTVSKLVGAAFDDRRPS
jgi:hypothetical protein